MIRSIDVKRAFTWEPIHKRRSQVDPDPEEVCTYTCTADARCDFKPCIEYVRFSLSRATMIDLGKPYAAR